MNTLEQVRISGHYANGFVYVDTEGCWGLREKGFDIDIQHTEIEDIGPADVTIATAALVAGAGVLSAAITALCTYLASRRKTGKIVIEGRDGTRIEVPEGTSEADLDRYIQKAKEISAERLVLIETEMKNRG